MWRLAAFQLGSIWSDYSEEMPMGRQSAPLHSSKVRGAAPQVQCADAALSNHHTATYELIVVSHEPGTPLIHPTLLCKRQNIAFSRCIASRPPKDRKRVPSTNRLQTSYCFDAQLRREAKFLSGKRGKGTSVVQACQLVELGSRVSQDTCIRRVDLEG